MNRKINWRRVKARVGTVNGGEKVITFWAIHRNERVLPEGTATILYTVCDRMGEQKDNTVELVLVRPEDIIYDKPAAEDLKYGGLHVVKS